MMQFVAFLLVVLSTSACTFASKFTIPLSKVGIHPQRPLDADVTQRHRAMNDPPTIPVIGNKSLSYMAMIGIGSPPTYYHLIVDTGSAHTWCGAGKPYVQTPTSTPTGEAMNVTYKLGYVSGTEYLDQVTLGPGLVIVNQSIGDANSSAGFIDTDGIMGLGPVELTLGSLTHDPSATVPTVMDNLVSQRLIEHKVFSVYINLSTNISDSDGILTFGDVDPCLYEGELTYVPVTDTYPASAFWGINATSCTYGNHSIISTSTAGIVDSGTSDDLFSEYLDAIPGAKLDLKSHVIEIPDDSIPSMQPLSFTIAGRVFTLSPAAQLVPTELKTALGLVPEKHYSVVVPLGQNGGQGMDFILGLAFVARHYLVFDADAHRIGIAQTNHTFSTYPG